MLYDLGPNDSIQRNDITDGDAVSINTIQQSFVKLVRGGSPKFYRDMLHEPCLV